ncbi:MAG: 3-isopropylmalate dehydratase small subunit 2 [Saprospiraceae bacterium]
MSFLQLKSSCIPLAMDNASVQEIVPARVSQDTSNVKFDGKLFYDHRDVKDETVKTDFVLDNPAYAGHILLTGANFGVGTPAASELLSLLDFGIKAIVASSFDSAFKAVAENLGLVLIEVPTTLLQNLMIAVYTNPRLAVNIDLSTQTLTVADLNLTYHFPFNPFQMLCQLQAVPTMDILTSLEKTLSEFKTVCAFPI